MPNEAFDESLFLRQCGLAPEVWSKFSQCHDSILAIFEDFRLRSEELSEVAVSLSRIVQKMPSVHSVRWRVKDPHHLVEKIIRKKAEGSQKYESISLENYSEVVTDLIGIRALHLFKGDFPEIHRSISETWEPREAIAFVRKGDSDEFSALYKELNLGIEDHPQGYRSVHYIVETKLTKQLVNCELQIRTIFEEGWSEIDHKIRYPSFSDEPLIRDFLTVFNRLCGAADEMGAFVKGLADSVKVMKRETQDAQDRANETALKLSEQIDRVAAISSSEAKMQTELAELKRLAEKQRMEMIVLRPQDSYWGHVHNSAHIFIPSAPLSSIDSPSLLLDPKALAAYRSMPGNPIYLDPQKSPAKSK